VPAVPQVPLPPQEVAEAAEVAQVETDAKRSVSVDRLKQLKRNVSTQLRLKGNGNNAKGENLFDGTHMCVFLEGFRFKEEDVPGRDCLPSLRMFSNRDPPNGPIETEEEVKLACKTPW